MTWRPWLAAAVAIVGALWWRATLPPPPQTLSAPSAVPVRGAVHVHTRQSDGSGTVDQVAAAAARAGLQFVVITDHGDGTRGPDAPSYRHGVLCIEGVEISTDGGHVIALDLQAMPYPLGGEARDVLEDVRRAGGVSMAAHPDSARPELRWASWDEHVDGLEWLNGDSAWRDEGWGDLARTLLSYPFRGAAALASLLDRPAEVLQRWDGLTQTRPVVALAASDAHARLGLGGGDPYADAAAIRAPSYEQVFRTLSVSLPEVRLSGTALEDARAVLDAIRTGQLYSSVDGIASPAMLSFSAVSGTRRAVMGGSLPPGNGVRFSVDTNAPAGSEIVLIKDGSVAATSAPPALEHTAPARAGVYRAEIRVPGAPGTPPVPWVVSNPIYVRASPVEVPRPRPEAAGSIVAYANGPPSGWRVEKNPRSEGALDVVPSVDGTQLTLRYALGGTRSEGPYVAAAMPAGDAVARADRVTFTGRAVRPMRISVQLRAPGGNEGRRWRRSVFLDPTARTVTVHFDDMRPVGGVTGSPPLQEVHDVLFVVDTVNTALGTNGQLWLDDVQFGSS